MTTTLYPSVSFGSINLNDGVNTWLLSGATVGGRSPVFDAVRSYDGTLVQRDVHDDFVTMSLPIRAMFATGGALDSWLAGLAAACVAGGTLTWQEAADAGVVSYTIAASPAPDVPRTTAYFMRHRVTFTLTLKRWP